MSDQTPTLYEVDPSIVDDLGEQGLIRRVTLRAVGGMYSHPWRCANCGTDHGGEGCGTPDFGKWHPWFEVSDE